MPHQGRPNWNGGNRYKYGYHEGDGDLVAVDGNAEITKRHANTDIEAELEASIKAKEEDNAKVDVNAKAEVKVGDRYHKRFHRFGEINKNNYHHNHGVAADVDVDAEVDVDVKARNGLFDLIEASAKVSLVIPVLLSHHAPG